MKRACLLALVAGLLMPGALHAQSAARSLLSELETLDRKLTRAEQRARNAERRSATMVEQLATATANLAAAKVRTSEALVKLRRRVRALAKMPAGSRLLLLGGARSLADLLDATRVLRWVARHDRRLHDHLQNETRQLQELEAQVKTQKAKLDELTTQLRADRDQIASARSERVALLKSMVEKQQLARLAAQEQSAARRDLAQMVQRLQPRGKPASSFSRAAGKLPWPAEGELRVSFGKVVDSQYHASVTHNGVDIGAPAGAEVQAVFAGKVVFADWLRGYGQIVIVDHGEGYHTLVAHLASIQAEVGSEINTGAALGTVGDTGSARGTVLYFEVRHKGVPVDPMTWLRR